MIQRHESDPAALQTGAGRPSDHDKVTTVYFDGSCPLCSIEISHYASQKGADQLKFVDVSQEDCRLEPDLSQDKAMARFHVRLPDGRLLSGARAFVAMWNTLPGWRWVARFASLPGLTTILESIYRLFLPVRPFLSRLVGWFGSRVIEKALDRQKSR